MTNEYPVPTFKLRKKGTFDLKSLLNGIKRWMRKEYYHYHEPKYAIKPDEVEIAIYGERKLNEYVRYRIEILIKGFDLKQVEVIKEGKKIAMVDGRFFIELGGKMMLDWQRRFGGNKLLQTLQDFYHKRIMKQTIEEVWLDHLLHKVIELEKFIGSKMELEVLAS